MTTIYSQQPFDSNSSGANRWGVTQTSGSSGRYYGAAPSGQKWVSTYVPVTLYDRNGHVINNTSTTLYSYTRCAPGYPAGYAKTSTGGYYVNRLVADPSYAPPPQTKPAQSLTISNPVVKEGGRLNFVVTRTDSNREESFQASAGGMGATPGVDYSGSSVGLIKFAKGQKAASFSLQTHKDNVVEGNEYVGLTVKYGRGSASGTGTIQDGTYPTATVPQTSQPAPSKNEPPVSSTTTSPSANLLPATKGQVVAAPVALQAEPTSPLSTFGIGGSDSVIHKGESMLVTGKSSPNAHVNITLNKRAWKPGEGIVSSSTYATADKNGDWSFDLSTYKDTWARGSEIGFSVRDNQGKNFVGSQIFSFAPDPVTGISPASASKAVPSSDLITGRIAVNGVNGATQWNEWLRGTAANEYFNGKGGQDELYGNGGSDVFDLRDYRGGSNGQSMGTNYATIRDFSADDHLIIGSSVTKIDQMSNGWARVWEGSLLSGVIIGDAASTLSLSSSQVHVM
jgi:hypothetical protein